MNVTRKSLYSGVENTLDINTTEEELEQIEICIRSNASSAEILEEFPDLTEDEVEFIINGVTREEFEDMKLDDEILGQYEV